MDNVKKGFTVVGFIAICFASVAQMADLAIIPAADSIFAAYPDAPMALLNFILSGPQLLIVLSAILSTLLMRRYNKRTLLLVSFLAMTLCSCLGGAVDQPVYVAVMRGCVGFFGGFCAPVSLAIIGETYHDDEEKNSMYTGLFSCVSAVFGFAFSMVAGILCVNGWRNVFKTYWAFIPMLFFMVFLLPRGNACEPSRTSANDSKSEKKESISMAPYLRILVFSFLAAMVINVITYLCSVFAAERGIGDASFAGLLSAIITLLTAVVCMVFGAIYKVLRRNTEIAMFVVAALALVLLMFAQGKAMAIAGSVLAGVAYGILVSYYYVEVGSCVPNSRISDTVPFITAMIGLGSFASSYFAYFVMGVLGTNLVGDTFGILAVLMVILGVLTFISHRGK